MFFTARNVASERAMVMAERSAAHAAEAEARLRAQEAEQEAEAARQAAEENAAAARKMLLQRGAAANGEPIKIHIDVDGKISVDGKTVANVEQLAAELTENGEIDGKLVVISADDDCPFRLVRAVIQRCEQSGIERIVVSGGE